MVIVALFVLAAIVSTSSAAFDPQEKSVIAADSQAQVQDMKCGEEGCGKKAQCSEAEKKCCGKDGACCKKAQCSEAKKAECAKEKKCCGKDGACCKQK